MAKLLFDQVGERFYETGVKEVALFVYDKTAKDYKTPVAWNGVTALTVSPSGAEATPLYADDIKYLNLVSAEEIGASIEAYTYPDEFGACDGSASPVAGMKIGQQARSQFGLCFKTTLGNDTANNEYGYKLHFLYNCLAAPSEKAYATINDSPEAITFSWELTTTPANGFTVEGVGTFKPTAYVEVTVKPGENGEIDAKFKALEDLVYGSESAEGKLPTPEEIYNTLKAA